MGPVTSGYGTVTVWACENLQDGASLVGEPGEVGVRVSVPAVALRQLDLEGQQLAERRREGFGSPAKASSSSIRRGRPAFHSASNRSQAAMMRARSSGGRESSAGRFGGDMFGTPSSRPGGSQSEKTVRLTVPIVREDRAAIQTPILLNTLPFLS